MAQTAVEMLAECLRLRHKEAYNNLYEDIEAYYKKIEKENILDAYKRGSVYMYHAGYSDEQINKSAEQYYNETYGKAE